MSSKDPILFENINLNNIVFYKIKDTNGKKVIYLKYKNGKTLEDLVTQTPTLWSTKKPTKLGENLHDLEIELIGKRQDKTNNFIQFLKKLDKFIINSAKENAVSWFKNADNVTYLNTIRESIDDNINKYYIKLKIIKSVDFKTLLKLDNKIKLKVNDIKENYWMKSIIQIFAIWIKPNNQFGIYLRPVIISFKKPIISNISYNFIKETEEEEDVLPESPPSEQNVSNIFIKHNQVVNQLTDAIVSENQTSILKLDVSSFDEESSSDEKQNNTLLSLY